MFQRNALFVQLRARTVQVYPREQLPQPLGTRLIVMSDTHGRHREVGPIPPGDVFVHCGDLMHDGYLLTDASAFLEDFNDWLGDIPCQHRVFIAGNHDAPLERMGKSEVQKRIPNGCYVENDVKEVAGLRLFGSPSSRGQSRNRAFQRPSIAPPVDVLVSHGPWLGKSDARLRLWGHLHSLGGQLFQGNSLCACSLDRNYHLVNAPILVVDLPPYDDEARHFLFKDRTALDRFYSLS